MSTKTIDYLFEDPPVDGQKFALVSIVGPHMNQKCDVWGMKVRGIASTIEDAKRVVQRLMTIDNNYDVFIVEVGKFFPLAVDPLKVGDIEYQNNELNNLMKSYLESKERANQEWEQRKQEMVKRAMEEGQNQEEMASRPEHPVSVLQRLMSTEEQLKTLENTLNQTRELLNNTKTQFESYTEEEKKEAEEKVNKLLEEERALQTVDSGKADEMSVDELRKELEKEFGTSS